MKKLIFIIAGILIFSGELFASENYYDDFDGTGNITWQVMDGSFTVEAGNYVGDSAVNVFKYGIASTGLSISEGTVQVKFKTEYIPDRYFDAFILFGYQDNSNFYLVGARDGANQWSVEKMEDGVRTYLTTSPDVIDSGVDYTMKAVFQNGAVMLYVDGVQKVTYDFGVIPSGLMGLAVHNAKSYFDDLEIETYAKLNIPNLVRFQGILKDTGGIPLDGTFTLTFRLYNVDTGGAPLWEEIRSSEDIENGFLDVELGSVTTLDLAFDEQYWLGIEVESDGEMTPRFKLTGVPYAFNSKR